MAPLETQGAGLVIVTPSVLGRVWGNAISQAGLMLPTSHHLRIGSIVV
jgi:hypothetical protein